MEKTISDNKLVEQKIPFVLRDLEMGFNAATRERNSIERLHQWQIIITTLIITVLIGNKDIATMIGNKELPIILPFIALFINIIIAWLEVEYRCHYGLIWRKTHNQERLLEETSLEKFDENIINWEFGIGISTKHFNKVDKKNCLYYRRIFKTVIWKRHFLLWYSVFSVLSLLPLIVKWFFK